jgi:signal transduction histidine kinase
VTCAPVGHLGALSLIHRTAKSNRFTGRPVATMHTHTSTDVSRHKCFIYEGQPSEQLPVVVPFLVDGLQDNWRCLYLGSPEMVDMVGSALTKHHVEVSRETQRGALVLSSDRDHLGNGTFHPRELVESLCSLIDSAVHDGFQGLCVTGDMKWELGADKNFSQLLEYEALLEQVLRDKPVRGVCQYHRDVLPPQAVRDALLTHRSTYIGGVLNRDNLYYIPPELLLAASHDGSNGAKQGEWMCQQIIRVLKAEQVRDKALTALQESEAHQRRLAEQLAEANRDLERRVAERTAELQVANRHLEAFSYSVSHDLRGPLQSIMGFTELLTYKFADALGEEGRRYLDRVCVGTKHMGELIEGLLTLGRVVKVDLNRAPVDLGLLAQAVAQEIREAEPHRQVELVIHSGLRAVADRVLLRAVLANLLGNAWKFTSKCSNAHIEVGKMTGDGAETIFFVKDNGAGFEMKDAKKLFSAFQRLHAQDEFPGTGVGLATVQRIIARHGGQIWAESHPGQGATFFFTLPNRQSNTREDSEPSERTAGLVPSVTTT